MKTIRKLTTVLIVITLLMTLLTGCGGTQSESQSGSISEQDIYIEQSDLIEFGDEMVPLSAGSPVSLALMPEASGTVVYKNTKAKIDASNAADGYVMIAFTGTAKNRLKVMVKGPSGTQYVYDLNKTNGEYEVFPLSDGNGAYSVGIYENISGTTYSTVFSKKLNVTLKDEFAPFLYPNQYVNFTANSQTVAKAVELTAGKTTDTEKIGAIYKFVVDNLTYDKQKAATVKSGYLPVVDEILASKKGICFDYAALMAAMLRSQAIPTKLVVGYTGEAYHAWINTYTKEAGWVNQVIYFDGQQWKLMDPTFASSAKSSESIMKYIGDGKNYQAKYLY